MKKHLILARPDLVISMPPHGKKVPPEGVHVDTRDPFWRRRLIEGSMILAPIDGDEARADVLHAGPDDRSLWTTATAERMTTPNVEAPSFTAEEIEQLRVGPVRIETIPPVDDAHAIEASIAEDLADSKE